MRTGFIFIFLFLAVVSPVKALETSSAPVLKPTQQQAEAAQLTAEFLQRFHYKPVKLDDVLSARIMDRFIDALDPDRLIFLQADVESFKTRSKEIDDGIKNQDLSIPFAIYNIYGERIDERMTFARQLLNEKFDFSSNESYSIARYKKPGRPRLRSVTRCGASGSRTTGCGSLAGKEDAAIRDTLTKRYENTLARANKSKADDVFQLFMAAYTTSVDPHTDYFGANASAEFDISMKLSLVGIGAVLQERDEFTTIRELTAGGPAQLSGKLLVGDRIVGVGGKDGAIKEVVGMRPDEVVQLIRGDKDSVVRLEILPADAGPDGQHRIISLVRDKISLDKQAAQKSVFTLQQGEKTRKIGIIKLPAFTRILKPGAKATRITAVQVAMLRDCLANSSRKRWTGCCSTCATMVAVR